MPRVKKEEKPIKVIKPSEDNGRTGAEVRDFNGQIIRVYTLSKHGEDFRKLADAFAAKNGYAVV
jgi:hypothetical protein